MKPFQIVILGIFGLGALLGFVFFATTGGGGGGGSSIGSVSVWGILPQGAMNSALAELASTDKRLAQVTYRELAPDTFGSELAQSIAEGVGPDLIIISQEELLSERAKLNVVPFSMLPERTFVDTFVPMAELFLGSEGIYGVPIVVDPLVLFYNTTTLTNAGIANPPSSWEAISGLAQQLSTITSTGAVTKSVIPFGGYANVRNARAILSTLFLQAGSPITAVSEGRVASVLMPRAEEARGSSLSALGFYAQFADPAKTVYTWNRTLPDSRTAFMAGDLLFYPGFASERASLQAANPNLSFDMAPIPQPAVASVRTTYGKLYASAIPRASMNPNGAAEVAVALSSASASSYIAALTGTASAVRAALVPESSDRYATIFYPEALRARGWLSPSSSVTDGIFAGMILNVTTGRQSISDALQTASESLDALLP